MVNSMTLALAISFEPHERDVMSRPPRVANQPLLNRFGIWRIAFISVLLLVFTFGTFYWLTHHGASVELARTAAVNAMVLGQVFYLVNSRFLLESCLSIRALMGNPLIPAAIGGVIVLQALFTYEHCGHHVDSCGFSDRRGHFFHHRRVQDAPALRLGVDPDQRHRRGCSRRDGV